MPGPNHRRGPRPLLLHLMLASLSASGGSSSAWLAAWKSLNAGLATDPAATPGCGTTSGATPRRETSNPCESYIVMPDAALLAGIAAYRRHPFVRSLADPPVIWSEGSSRLLDFGDPEAPPVLFVPSLVNRAYVLDLMPGHSMLRFLAAGGARPLLLDWGFPGEAECAFTLTDYVAGRLLRAIGAVGRPVALAGYCMGGLMAVAAAQLRPDLIRRLVLLATPWDFWASEAAGARRVAELLPLLDPAFSFAGAMPVDSLQMLFSFLDPGCVGTKYRDFGTQDQTSARAHMFVAIEDWLNDGVPLAAPVAREVLGGWYGRNTPAAGTWRIAGLPIVPEMLRLPCFVAIPERDRLVPPETAWPLAEAMAGCDVVRPPTGHIGMVAGSQARVALWETLGGWLKNTG